MTVVLETRRDFTLETYRAVAVDGAPVTIGETSLAAMRASRERFEALLGRPDIDIYGVTTGYAQNAGRRLSAVERRAQASMAPDAPDVAVGEAAPTRVVRGIVFARLANFVEGHAAISVEVAQQVAAMLDGRELPTIPIQGQGGAGEILALAPLFAGIAKQVRLREKDALSLINGAPAAAALTADAALEQRERTRAAVRACALAIDAYGASTDAYDSEFEALWVDDDDAWAIGALRGALRSTRRGGPQAPASFRAAPRILGQIRRAVRHASDAAVTMLRAVTDNPMILPDGRVLSNGGFHSAQAPAALDAITSATVAMILLMSRLSTRIAESADLDGENRADGLSRYKFMPMAILGYEEEARALALATLPPGGEGGGYGVNDLSSPAFGAWSKQRKAGDLLDHSIATLMQVARAKLDGAHGA